LKQDHWNFKNNARKKFLHYFLGMVIAIPKDYSQIKISLDIRQGIW
jgi:hypothetical protein